jgi:hypothetical protein
MFELDRYMRLDRELVGKLQFKSANKVSLEADVEILGRFKNDLLSENVSRDVKGKYFYFLQRYLRDTQKARCPGQAHYTAEGATQGKAHLEHPIPQNRILQAYLEGHISEIEAIHMPLCLIADGDKHILEGEWQYNATWQYPFKRYKMAGFTKEIKNLRGEQIDMDTWSIEDHFLTLGVIDDK